MTTHLQLLGALFVNLSSVALAVEGPRDGAIFTAQDAQLCRSGTGAVTRAVDAQALPDDGSVWRVGSNRWNLDWESKYSKWVATEVDTGFFVRYNIPTDCADAAMSIRIIFARIHHLPIVFDTGQSLISFDTKAFAGKSTVHIWNEANWKEALKTDQRFRAYLYKVQIDMGTPNLPQSTYPIELSSCPVPGAKPKLSKYVTEGTVLLDVHHTRFIARIDTLEKVEPIQQMNSTIPRDVRELSVGEPRLGSGADETGRGILKFNWAVNCNGTFTLVADTKMPGYSLQQYSLPGRAEQADYIVEVTPGKRGKPDVAYVDQKLALLKTNLVARLELVSRAQKMLKQDPHVFDVETSEVYDNYSTPSRDRALAEFFERMRTALFGAGLNDYYAKNLANHVIVLGNGKYMTYGDLEVALKNRKVSSSPNAALDQRWGWQVVQEEANDLAKTRADLKLQVESEIKAYGPYDRFQYNYGWIVPKSKAELDEVTARLKALIRRGAVVRL